VDDAPSNIYKGHKSLCKSFISSAKLETASVQTAMESPEASTIRGVYPLTGMSILIAGGGIGGLTFAIEAYRKGHDIRILEKRPNFEGYGKDQPDTRNHSSLI
jgi:heterodisulfide reductase subunit A-like polyferredoxin